MSSLIQTHPSLFPSSTATPPSPFPTPQDQAVALTRYIDVLSTISLRIGWGMQSENDERDARLASSRKRGPSFTGDWWVCGRRSGGGKSDRLTLR